MSNKDTGLYLKLLEAVRNLEAELMVTTPSQQQLKKDIHKLYNLINSYTGSYKL